MISPLAKFIDRSVLKVAYAMLPHSVWREAANERDLNLSSALISQRAGLHPRRKRAVQLEFDGPRHFTFPTPRPCEFAQNNVVHGRLYRCADAWQERPVIVLLHGGGDFAGHQFAFHSLPLFHRAGFNAVTLELPYHFHAVHASMVDWKSFASMV